jgi:hypothetical protein
MGKRCEEWRIKNVCGMDDNKHCEGWRIIRGVWNGG